MTDLEPAARANFSNSSKRKADEDDQVDKEIVENVKDSENEIAPIPGVPESAGSNYFSGIASYASNCPAHIPSSPKYQPCKPSWVPNWSRDQLFERLTLAQCALNCFNNTNGTRYGFENDKLINGEYFVDSSGSWFHCCFDVVDYSTNQVNAEDSSIKRQFFAEVKLSYPKRPTVVVTKYMIIEGETKVGCETCVSVTHPVDFSRARPDQEDRKVDRKMAEVPEKTRTKFANLALKHFNNINSTKYEVQEDELIDSEHFVISSVHWFHCCFDVVDSSTKQVNTEGSSIKQPFFAELNLADPSDPTVTKCMIIEGETQIGCENCRRVTHPVAYYGGCGGNGTDASCAMSSKEDGRVDRDIVENAKDSGNE